MDLTAALLWEAARPTPRDGAVAALLETGADAERASGLAHGHGLGPLLWRALASAGDDTVLGGSAVAALKADAELWRAHSRMLLPRAVGLLSDPLLQAGIEPVIWKGPAIAVRYPDPALRPMADLDVIVPSGQHLDATAILERAGWRALTPHAGEHYDTALVHPSLPGLPVELHFGLNSWRHRPNRLRSDELWARRVPIELFGTRTFGLAPDDEVVAVAAHAGKPYHVFSRLIWATDLAVVTLGTDWGAVRDRAAALECRTVVAVGLRLAARLGADPPWWITEIPESGDRRRAVNEILDPDWPLLVCTDERDEELHLLQDRLRYALVDRPARAMAMLAGEVADAPKGRRARRLLGSMRRARRAWLAN